MWIVTVQAHMQSARWRVWGPYNSYIIVHNKWPHTLHRAICIRAWIVTFPILSLYQYLNATKLYHILSIDIRFNSGYITHTLQLYTLWDHILYAHWRHLICTCWPEDGRNAVETCSQKLLNVSALTIVYFIILLLCMMWNIYACRGWLM